MIFCQDFSVSHNEKLRGGSLCVSEKIMFGENMKKGCISRFSVKYFLSYSAEKNCGEHPCLSEKFRYGRKLRKEWGYHDFLSRFFCLTYRKTSWWKCCFFKISGMVKIYE